jgi:hypothetical protein
MPILNAAGASDEVVQVAGGSTGWSQYLHDAPAGINDVDPVWVAVVAPAASVAARRPRHVAIAMKAMAFSCDRGGRGRVGTGVLVADVAAFT